MTTRFTRRQVLGLFGALALPVDLSLAAPATNPVPAAIPPSERGPDLGNLYDLIAWLRQENTPRLSFLDRRWKSLAAWKRTARPLFREHLSYDPKPLPMAAELVNREERDGFTLETVKIRATAAYDIPARILIPSGRKGRMPGVLALHCHSGHYVWGHEKAVSNPKDSAVL